MTKDAAEPVQPREERTLPVPPKMKSEEYEEQLLALQVELVKCQRWVVDTGQRVVLVFEGRDAAGKGGTIQRFMQHLNPRNARHVALPKPNDTERGEWYFQRYVEQLPTAGEFVFFDRSWYNRAGVERVMGFCSPDQYTLFLRQVPEFERLLVEDGILLFKLWLAINREVQHERLEARKADPLKSWKLSPIDPVSLAKFDEYTEARIAMFAMTDTRESPWTAVNSNNKRRARVNAIRHVLWNLPYPDKDASVVVPPEPQIVAPAREMFPPLWGGGA